MSRLVAGTAILVVIGAGGLAHADGDPPYPVALTDRPLSLPAGTTEGAALIGTRTFAGSSLDPFDVITLDDDLRHSFGPVEIFGGASLDIRKPTGMDILQVLRGGARVPVGDLVAIKVRGTWPSPPQPDLHQYFAAASVEAKVPVRRSGLALRGEAGTEYTRQHLMAIGENAWLQAIDVFGTAAADVQLDPQLGLEVGLDASWFVDGTRGYLKGATLLNVTGQVVYDVGPYDVIGTLEILDASGQPNLVIAVGGAARY